MAVRKWVVVLAVLVCLVPSLALAGKSYSASKIMTEQINKDEIVFKSGDKITGGSRITLELYYEDALGNQVGKGNGTIKSITIEGEKVNEWKISSTAGSYIQLNNTIYQGAFAFTMKPAYAVADAEGYFTISGKTYGAYLDEKKAKDKQVKFAGQVIAKENEIAVISIEADSILVIESDAEFNTGDKVKCKGTITGSMEYSKGSVPKVSCTEVLLQKYEEIKKGSKGPEVIEMKERLRELGYFSASAELSEAYNDTCAERVKQFQKNNGLAATGNADVDTLTILYSDAAKGK